MLKMQKKRILGSKQMVLLIIIILILTYFVTISLAPDFNKTDSSSGEPDEDDKLTRNELNEQSKSQVLDTLSTGATKFTMIADPDGEMTSLSVPLDYNISSATLSLEGRIKSPLNQYKLGGRPVHVTSADLNNDGNLDILSTDLETHKFYVLYGLGDLNFKAPVGYETGDLPLWSTINDFNNDGFIDVAIANEGANTITVYQNKWAVDETFSNRKDYKIGDIPRSIISGDFNNDGWVDLASISSNDDKLWINFNQKNASISFTEPVNYSIDRSPVGINTADMNSDGFLDLIIIHVGAKIFIGNKQYTNSVSILLNNGEGEFPERVDYIVGKKPGWVIAEDFNNDGHLDIATSNYASYDISILLNRGNGYLKDSINYSLNDNSSSGLKLRAGDIDGDGDLDIVSICSSLNHLEIIKNRGDGTFEKYYECIAGHSPSDLALADFNSDGNLDIATSNSFDGTISILPNNGDGIFTTFDFYYVGGWPRGISNGDIDNDGDLDIITANYLGGSLSVRYNNGNGEFPRRYDRHIAVEPFAVIVEDFDKDGNLDLASADEGLFQMVLIYNDGDGSFVKREKVSHSLGGYPYSIIYHDFNSDGKSELVTSNNLQQSISILWNIGNESGDLFAPFINYSFTNQHPFGLHYGDMDGDGDDDLLCTNLGFESEPEDFISIIWNNGNGTFSGHTDYQVGVNPINLRAADLDRDGDLDVVVANKNTNSTTILFNQNNQTLGSRVDYAVGTEPMGIELVDFDQDGDLDIITANHANDSISIMYNQGDGKFSRHIEYPNGPQPTYLSIADFNQDGNLDIAASNKLTSSISVHQDLHYPEQISVYLGDLTTPIFQYNKRLDNEQTLPDFTNHLKDYLIAHSSDPDLIQTKDGPAINVPIKITAQKKGIIDVLDINIQYKSTKDNDQDNIPDVDDPDDDNDGLPDIWEFKHDLDPYSAEDINGPNGDPDLDTYTNIEEFEHNTDPRDGNDYPKEKNGDSGNDVCMTPGFEVDVMSISIITILGLFLFKGRKKYRK